MLPLLPPLLPLPKRRPLRLRPPQRRQQLQQKLLLRRLSGTLPL